MKNDVHNILFNRKEKFQIRYTTRSTSTLLAYFISFNFTIFSN